MEENNKSLVDYLNYFCNLDYSLNYAVLINGDWGIGKTFFIKSFIRKNSSQFNFFYVSLYGLTTHDSINNQLYKISHPFTSSYEFKLFSSILKKILHSKTAVDLDIKIFDEDSSNPSKRSTSIDFNSPRNIIIFDDIERCKMPINDVLGYINYFVEHTSCKVIVICDESKLIEKKSEKENYLFIKEKTIGKTFNFTPNTQQALHEFISEQKAPKINDVYFKNIQKILECYEKSDIKNLRSLRCCLFDFSKLYDDLPHDLKENSQFIDDFLYIFIVIFMGIKTGIINTIHIEKCDMKNLFLDHNNEERKIIEEFSSYINKHSNLSYLDLVLSNSAWVHLIKNEFGIDEIVIEAIKGTKYFPTELPLWLTLWNYKRNDIEKTESALKIAIEMLKNGAINSLGELIHIAGVFIIMIKAKAIDMKMKDFIELTEKNIERVISSFADIPKDDFFLFDDITFFDHGVHEENSPEMKKIIISLKENIGKKEKEIVNNEINTIFESVSKATLIPDDTIKSLQELLVNVNLDKNILILFKTNDFLDLFLMLPQQYRLSLKSILDHRLNDSGTTQEVKKGELAWMKKFISSLEKKIKTTKNILSPLDKTLLNMFVKSFKHKYN